MTLAESEHIHFIGIGGAGLSAIAKVLIEQGKKVSGSDLAESPATAALAALGARVHIGHDPANLDAAQLVVASSAVRADNVELAAARTAGVPVLKRESLLGEMMRGRRGIAVAGTHGKTTTTALAAFCLTEAGLDPTYIVGGVLANYGTNARAGRGEHFVVEADEYDHMFLGLAPRVALVTNIEFDHPDCFADEAAMVRAFQAFVMLPSLQAPGGAVILCGDSPNARALRAVAPQALSYGFAEHNEYRIIDPQETTEGAEFVVARDRRSLCVARTILPGRHNMLNVCAVVALGDVLRVNMDQWCRSLPQFRGTQRRFERRGEVRGALVIDDYAHHPTEIRATLAAARARFGARRIWAVFQPHTYSRTRALLDEFAGAFADADEMIVTEIFPSRETDTLGISGRAIVERTAHARARFVPSLGEAEALLRTEMRQGDVVLLLGAGDINTVGTRLLGGLVSAAPGAAAGVARPAERPAAS